MISNPLHLLMIDEIKRAYAECDNNNCHQRLNHSFYIKDGNPSIVLSTSPQGATCYIENSRGVNLDLIHVDNCLIDDRIQKCDLVLTDNTVIWFIELKEVKFNGNIAADRKRVVRASKKAVKQLASTINDFINKGIGLSQTNVFALISYPPFLNQQNPITIPSTSAQLRISQFRRLCNFTTLYEGNHLVF